MNERQMFEKSFERPKDYFYLSEEEQWAIDKNLGILDWQGRGLSEDDKNASRLITPPKRMLRFLTGDMPSQKRPRSLVSSELRSMDSLMEYTNSLKRRRSRQ